MTSNPAEFTGAKPGFIPEPELVMSLAVWQEIMGYVHACPSEVNGFGTLDRLGDLLRLDEVFILEQTVSPAHAEVSPLVLAKHLTEMVQRGEDTARLRFQWHSHVNMSAYFSGTDLANIETYTSDWMVSMVLNKRSEYQLRLDVYRPWRVWTPLRLKVIAVPNQALVDHCHSEIQSKVRQRGVFGNAKRVNPLPSAGSAFLEGEEIEVWTP